MHVAQPGQKQAAATGTVQTRRSVHPAPLLPSGTGADWPSVGEPLCFQSGPPNHTLGYFRCPDPKIRATQKSLNKPHGNSAQMESENQKGFFTPRGWTRISNLNSCLHVLQEDTTWGLPFTSLRALNVAFLQAAVVFHSK